MNHVKYPEFGFVSAKQSLKYYIKSCPKNNHFVPETFESSTTGLHICMNTIAQITITLKKKLFKNSTWLDENEILYRVSRQLLKKNFRFYVTLPLKYNRYI